MNSDRNLYAVALIIFVVGISGGFRTRPAEWVACIPDRVGQWVEDAAGRVDGYTQHLTERFSNDNSDWQARAELAMAGTQAKFDCVEATLARKQAALARLQAERERIQDRLRQVVVVQHAMVPRKLVVEIPKPVIEVSDDTE